MILYLGDTTFINPITGRGSGGFPLLDRPKSFCCGYPSKKYLKMIFPLFVTTKNADPPYIKIPSTTHPEKALANGFNLVLMGGGLNVSTFFKELNSQSN